jgi:hypothetical protein
LLAGFVGLDGIGNDLNNTLTGNEFANTLTAASARTRCWVGAGDDHYFVDSTFDVGTESIANFKGGGNRHGGEFGDLQPCPHAPTSIT